MAADARRYVDQKMKLSRKISRLLTVAALVLVPSSIMADQYRHHASFLSSDGRYQLKRTAQAWTLVDLQGGNQLYSISGRFASKTVFVEEQGRSIAVVDDYSEAPWASDVPVLEFYSNGRPLSQFTLGELLSERLPVSLSASHFTWFIGEPQVVESTLVLTTYELVTYTFDLKTGQRLSRERDQRLSDDAVYAYGRVSKDSREEYRMEVVCPLSPQIAVGSEIKFRLRESKTSRPISSNSQPWGVDKLKSNAYYAVIIQNGEYVAHERLIINTCVKDEPNSSVNRDVALTRVAPCFER
jgi:hypothetical protein